MFCPHSPQPQIMKQPHLNVPTGGRQWRALRLSIVFMVAMNTTKFKFKRHAG